jgi:predicted histone-like DNA-binding protein
MTIKYRMQRFGPREDKWWFRIAPVRTRTLKEMVQHIEDASSLTRGDVLAAVEALVAQLRRALVQGESVRIDGLGTFRLSAQGLADTHDARLDPQQLNVTLLPDAGTVRYVRQKAETRREKATVRAPNPGSFTDVVSGRRDAYTPGGIAKLYGSVLKLNPDDPEQGVFFVGGDGSRTRVAVYAHVGVRWIHFLIPQELSGPQELVVRAQPRFAPQVREGKLEQVLEPA